jgi:hypothetical protein
MAHFAKLDEYNNVLEVHVVSNAALDANDEEASGIAFLTDWSGGYTNWKQTSYSGKIRYNYAGVGYTYDPIDDAFIAPKPFESWILNSNKRWEAPLPYPQDDKMYVWNEETQSWDEMA